MMEQTRPLRDVCFYLDKDGRLCYFELNAVNAPRHRLIDAVAPTLFQMENIVKGSDFLWREYKRLTDVLIDGDYTGPLRGETNCALNVAHFLISFEKAAEETLGRETVKTLRARAYEIRAKRWPEHLGW